MILLEYPHYTRPIAGFASKNGQYVRPIKGAMADIRIEDMGLEQYIQTANKHNYIGKLPDVPGTKQIGVWFFTQFSTRTTNDATKAQQMIESGQFIVLPSTPDDELWEYTQRPWWEFMAIYDPHGMPIKAAPYQSNTQYTVENVDERLDEFEENHGKVDVLSPFTFEKMAVGAMAESYIQKLERISPFPYRF
jgi:hypothetical protein